MNRTWPHQVLAEWQWPFNHLHVVHMPFVPLGAARKFKVYYRSLLTFLCLPIGPRKRLLYWKLAFNSEQVNITVCVLHGENQEHTFRCWLLFNIRLHVYIYIIFYIINFLNRYQYQTPVQYENAAVTCHVTNLYYLSPSAYSYPWQMYYEGRNWDRLRTAPFAFLLSYCATNDVLGFSTLLLVKPNTSNSPSLLKKGGVLCVFTWRRV